MADPKVRILKCACKSSERTSHTGSTSTSFDTFNDKLLDFFNNLFIIVCVCVPMCVRMPLHTCHSAYVHVRRQLPGVASLCTVGSEDLTQLCQSFWPLSHLPQNSFSWKCYSQTGREEEWWDAEEAMKEVHCLCHINFYKQTAARKTRQNVSNG